MADKTLTINGQVVQAQEGQTLLQAAREAGFPIPTLCHLEGLSDPGSCRVCMVEQTGSSRLLPACTTRVSDHLVIETNSKRVREERRKVVELLFAERNHVCAVCVACGHCELQDLAIEVGMDHVRFDYDHPDCKIDLSHHLYGIDHNRCVLCTRCVRACDEVEGAHTWDVAGWGKETRVVTDHGQPWGNSETCTSCGKCVQACPTAAIFIKGMTVAESRKHPAEIGFLVKSREHLHCQD